MLIRDFIDMLKLKEITFSLREGKLFIQSKGLEVEEHVLRSIRQRKAEIIYFLSFDEGQDISPAPLQEDYPLSHSQRRLWLIDQVVKKDALYTVGMYFVIDQLNLSALKSAFYSLLERHEVLRTVYVVKEGDARQRVCSPDNLIVNLKTISLLTVDPVAIRQRIDQEFLMPIDLQTSPFQATILTTPDSRGVLILVVHHIAIDAWSVPLLRRDLNNLYEKAKGAVTAALPPLTIQFKDYTVWQQERIHLGYLNAAREYWIAQFPNPIPTLNLPMDAPRSEKKSYNGAGVTFQIDKETSSNLKAIADNTAATLFMACTAVIKVLLFRYCQQNEIMVGTVVADRNHTMLEEQIGFYSNTVVLYDFVEPSGSFKALLEGIRRTTLAAFQHQEYPFDLLVNDLGVKSELNRNPLFDVFVAFDELNTVPEHHDQSIESDNGVNKFDLGFSFTHFADQTLGIEINYNVDLFKKETINRMVGHIKTLIHDVVIHPDLPISHLRLMTLQEVDQIIQEFNASPESPDFGLTIPDLMEHQCQRMPDSPCIVSNTEKLSFSEFNALSNRLAHHLMRRFKVTGTDKIAVIMDNTVDRMIGLMAIVKIGATYVPVDKAYPIERMQFIIDKTSSTLVLVDQKDKQAYPQFNTYSLVRNEWDREPTHNPARMITGLSHFTILFTSGSTGIPKAVPIHHTGLINRMKWLYEKYNFTSNDVIYLKTPYVFDVSIGELFMPLCFGAKILVASSDSTDEIVQNALTHHVTYLHFSPTYLNKFLSNYDPKVNAIESVRFCLASGESLLPDTVEKFYSKFKCPLINLYGPTEASIEVSYYETRKGDAVIPIGKPIKNVTLYILDNQQQLMPVGVPGEVVIGGTAVAEGYLHDKELTDSKFIPDPFSLSSRLYRTGDVGKWNANGQIEFLGRKDNQVSINGNRIELGEIENIMMQYPDVVQACIIVKQSPPQDPQLIGFFSVADEISPPPATTQLNMNGKSQRDLIESIYETTNLDLNKPLWRLLQEGLRKNADHCVLVKGDMMFTASFLLDRIEQAAAVLVHQFKITSESSVAVTMKPSDKLVIVLLAIVRAGATFCLIDQENPKPRVRSILSDLKPHLVVVDHIDQTGEECNIVLAEQLLNTEPGAYPNDATGQPETCYVAFTSGSTGNPKGVCIPNSAIVHYVSYFQNYFNLTHDDTVLQQASIGFDTFLEEVFPCIAVGARLVILPEGGRDIAAMITAFSVENISLASLTPAIINELNNYPDPIPLPKRIISGGDVLSPKHINMLIDKTEIYNTYGPTEVTICCTFAKVNSVEEASNLGRPIGDVYVYVLNSNLQLCGIGEIGEIYVSGCCVATGYLNSQNETDARFFPDPFTSNRMYRTGDLGMWNESGVLEYKGRTDDQVKINGYRIELNEISQALMKHPAIAQAVTLAPKRKNDFTLTAYYQPHGTISQSALRKYLMDTLPYYMLPNTLIEVQEFKLNLNGKIDKGALTEPDTFDQQADSLVAFRRFLRTKLPAYMIPHDLFKLDKFPLTTTGKIDRKKLSELYSVQKEVRLPILPSSETEKSLVGIWEKILRVEINDSSSNFFELGGNSIKATQLVKAIYKNHNAILSIADVFNYGSLAEMADRVEEIQASRTYTIDSN